MRIPLAVQERRDAEFEQTTSRAEVDQLLRKWAAEDDAVARSQSAEGRELAALRRRVAGLERSLRPGGTIMEPLLDALGQVLADERSKFREQVEARDAKIDLLTARVSDLETNRLKFMGTHEIGAKYKEGSIVTRSGSLWHCDGETRTVPGTAEGARSWQLIVKSGQQR